MTWPRPFQGWFGIHGLALAIINLSTKCGVSNFTHYEETKGNKLLNIENEVILGS